MTTLEYADVTSFGPVHFLAGQERARYPSGNLILVDGGVPTVIDPISRHAAAAVAKATRVTQLFNSHFHEDHRCGNDLFPEAALCVPELEREGYADVAGLARMYGDPVEELAPHVDRWIARFPGMARTDVARTFAFGDTMTWGDVRVEIVPLPGHSPGQSGFFFPDQRVLFIADVDLTKFGPWYGTHRSDIDDFLETIDRLLGYVDRVDALLTSHERGVVRGDLRRELEAYRSVIHARDHRLLAFLAGGARMWEEIRAHEIVYFYPSKARHYGDDYVMIRMHLERLLRAGIVVRDGEFYALGKSARASMSAN